MVIVLLIFCNDMLYFRADKMKALRKSLGQLSEAGSENSGGTRESTEIKIVQTLPVLTRPPERGILKKHPRSLDDILGATSSACTRPSFLDSAFKSTGKLNYLRLLGPTCHPNSKKVKIINCC